MPLVLERDRLRLRPALGWQRLLAAGLFEGRAPTSRARWLNGPTLALQRLLRHLPPLQAVRAPVFLVGTGRSGTTFLANLLGLHPGLVLLNEPRALWHAARGDEDLIGAFTRAPARLRLGREDADPRSAAALRRSYGAFLRLAGGRRLLDKSPELVHRVDLVLELFPDARLIWLVRSGAATARSVARWSQLHGSGSGASRRDWWGRADRKWDILVHQGASAEADLAPHVEQLAGLQDSLARGALEWTLAMRAGARALERHPRAVLRVDHERLTAAPGPELERLLAFLELAPHPRVFEHAARRARPATGVPGAELELPPPLRAALERTQFELDRN